MQQPNSDEEEEQQGGSFVEVLASNVPRIIEQLRLEGSSDASTLETSYNVKIVPLGSLRLKLVELLGHLLKLNKEPLLSALLLQGAEGNPTFLGKLSGLLARFPWNNFLQLKAVSIFEDLFEGQQALPSKDSLREALKASEIGPTLTAMAASKTYHLESNRSVRHGYMAVVVKIANTIVKNRGKEGVQEYLDSLGEEWRAFSEGELKSSNEANTRSLGGQQPRQPGNDDDDMEGSMSMDSILQRFQNFSTERSKRESLASSQNDDDEDEEEDEEEEDQHVGFEPHTVEPDEDKLSFLKDRDSQYAETEQPPKPSALVEQEPLAKEYIDNNFWKVELYEQKSIEELMAEMEL